VHVKNRFSEIAKQTPPTPTPRIQQQANVIIPYSRQELFGNRRPAALSIAARLKKVRHWWHDEYSIEPSILRIAAQHQFSSWSNAKRQS
jgi:hypothetical protein